MSLGCKELPFAPPATSIYYIFGSVTYVECNRPPPPQVLLRSFFEGEGYIFQAWEIAQVLNLASFFYIMAGVRMRTNFDPVITCTTSAFEASNIR